MKGVVLVSFTMNAIILWIVCRSYKFNMNKDNKQDQLLLQAGMTHLPGVKRVLPSSKSNNEG